MPKRQIELYLADISLAIRRIEKYIKGFNITEFFNDPKTLDAVIRNLEIIGEAVKNIPPAVKKKYPKIPWAKIAGMRNKIIHEYFGIDEEIIWQTIKGDIPKLKRELKKIKKLYEVLCNNLYDFDRDIVEDIQLIRSHEVGILQITDLLIGAIAYNSRNLKTSEAKLKIIERIKERSRYGLDRTTLLKESKLNLLVWQANEDN